MFCQYCGASLADGTKFCTECGQRQPAAHKPVQNVCPRCGAVEEADAVFCSTCGARLGASAQPNGGYTQPNGGYTQPNGWYTQPNGGYTQPNGGYSQPGAGYTQPGASARSGTAAGQSRTASGRAAAQQPVRPAGSFTVTAKPEARVLGIPVRGKALWVVLGVIAVIVIALVVLSRYGGGDRPEADDGGSAFSVRETVPAREETRDEAEQKQTLMPAGGLRERIEQTMGDREEQEAAGPEQEAAEPEPEDAEPEPEDAETEPEAAAQPSRRDPNGYSTSETPTLADFQWADYDVLHGARPEGRETLGRGEVSGGWKCYMVDDPEGVSDSTMERLMNVYIDMNGVEAVVTLDWFYAHDYGTDEGFDEDGPDSVFDGFWQDEMIGAVGPGRVELTDFWYLDGFEYAVGEFMWPDGVPAAMFLVRP